MGRPSDPDYWKKWRAAHPEYRERERARLKARQQARTTEQRREERQRARTKALAARSARQRHNESSRKHNRKKRQTIDWYETYGRSSYERRKAKILWDSRFNMNKKRAMKYLEIADEALASIGLRPDSRVHLGSDTFDDARGAAALAVVELKGYPRARQLDAAVRAASVVRRDATSRTHTTLSLDAPASASATEPLGNTLEGNWYL